MDVRLVAIDLDGTLLNSEKQVTEASAAVLRAAWEERRVWIVLASARPPRSVLPFYEVLDLQAPMINYNGALVFDPHQKRALLHRPIPLETAWEIVELAREMYPRVLVSAEHLDHWYTDRVDPAYTVESALTSEPDVVSPIRQWLKREVTKLLLLGDPEPLEGIRQEVLRRLPYQVSVVSTEGHVLQIMHATASKSQALRTVAAELGVDRTQVVAIGDNSNDVGMLQWAGIGVAMENASPRALAVADVVTDHHDADGAANAIRRILHGEIPGPADKTAGKSGDKGGGKKTPSKRRGLRSLLGRRRRDAKGGS